VPFAAWVDSTGGRKPFLVLLSASLLGMLGVTTLVYAYYPSGLTPGMYPLLLVLGVLCGCGIATFSVGIGQVSYWFPKAKQGGALGIFGGAGNLAPGVFSFILPFALKHLGLAGSYLTWLIFLGVGTLLYYFAGRNAWYFQLIAKGQTPEQAREKSRALGQEMFPIGSTKESLRLSARSWKTWVLVGLYFTTFGGFLALTAWLPTYWREYLQQTEVVAGLLTGTYAVLASLVRVGAGKLTDRLGGERTLVFGLAAMATGAVIVGTGSGLPLAITGIVIMAVGMGTGNAGVFKLVPQEVPEAVGGAAGWVGGLGAFGGFALPPLMALAIRAFGKAGYAYGFLVFVGLAIASMALMFVLKKARSTTVAVRVA
jgi:NNP family nitrate/nitrite transporter-like MFS transporter